MTMKKVLAIVVGIFATIVVVGGILTYFFITKSALYRLAIGAKNIAKEVSQTDNPLLIEDGMGTLINTVGKKNAMADYSINVSGNPMLNGITLGMDGIVKRDMESKKFYLSADASTSLIPLLSVEVYANQNDVYFQIPEIYKGSIVFQAKDFDGQYNMSSLKDFIDKNIDQDIDFDFYREFAGWKISEENFLDAYQGDVKSFLKDIDISEEKEYEMDSEKESMLEQALGYKQKLTSYIIELDSEKMGLQEPLKARIVLNQKNRIVMLEVIDDVLLKNGYSAYGKLLLCGKEVSINDTSFEGTLTRRDGGSDVHSSITMDMEYIPGIQILKLFGSGTMDIWEPGMVAGWDVTLSDFVPNKKITVSLEDLHMAIENEEIGKVTGKVTLQPMTEEIIIPDGDEYAIFEMNKLELGGLLWKWKDNFGGVGGMIFGNKISDKIAEEVGKAIEENVNNKVGDIAGEFIRDLVK